MLLKPKQTAGRGDDQAKHAEEESPFHGIKARV
jgi:hypothetical protein